MKTFESKIQNYIFCILVIVFAIGSFTSCSTSKKATKKAIGIDIKELPCQKDAKPNKDYFTAFSSAKSLDLSLAREKGLTMAKERLASLINSTIKSTTDRYINERKINQNSEFEQKFENLTREVVMQTLSDIEVVCDKLTMSKNKEFHAFITIQVKKEDVINRINKKISTNSKLKLDFDKDKYQTIFNEETGKTIIDQ